MQGARSVALAHHLSTSATLTHESRAMAVEQLAADRFGEHIGGIECWVGGGRTRTRTSGGDCTSSMAGDHANGTSERSQLI